MRDDIPTTLQFIADSARVSALRETLEIVRRAKDDFREFSDAIVALRDVERLIERLEKRATP